MYSLQLLAFASAVLREGKGDKEQVIALMDGWGGTAVVSTVIL